MRNVSSPTPVKLAQFDRHLHPGWSNDDALEWSPPQGRTASQRAHQFRTRHRMVREPDGIARANARAEAAEKKAQAAIEEVHRITRLLDKMYSQHETTLAAQRARLEAVVGPLDPTEEPLAEDVPFSEEFFRALMDTDSE